MKKTALAALAAALLITPGLAATRNDKVYAAVQATLRIADATRGRKQLVVVGLPLAVRNSLYNCGAVLADGAVLGIVPKQFIPNYKEFYERRWFSSASDSIEMP